MNKGLESGWKRVKHRPPPTNLQREGARDAILWAAASAVVVGLAALLAEWGASAAWKGVTGKAPPR
jgi:hypothetical protein